MDSALAQSPQVPRIAQEEVTVILPEIPQTPATGVHRRVAPSTTPTSTRRQKLSVYRRVLQVMEAFRTIGTPLDGRLVGAGDCILVAGTREAGEINASLHLQGDRYAVTFHLQIKSVTDEELAHREATGVDPTNLKAFNALFDLMRLRQQAPTFSPDESGEVLTAIESIFGCSP